MVFSFIVRYSGVMNRWDAYFSEGKTFQPLNEVFLTLLLKEVERRIGAAPATVIDLGCGEGDAVVKFARRGLDALGLDGSRVGIEHAKRAIEDAGLSGVKVLLADLEMLTPTDSYDIVFCRLTYAFINDKDRFIATIKSLLAKNGVFVLITPVTYPNIKYEKVDKPGIAVDFETINKMLSEYFDAVRVWHHDYFADHGDTVTFIAK